MLPAKCKTLLCVCCLHNLPAKYTDPYIPTTTTLHPSLLFRASICIIINFYTSCLRYTKKYTLPVGSLKLDSPWYNLLFPNAKSNDQFIMLSEYQYSIRTGKTEDLMSLN